MRWNAWRDSRRSDKQRRGGLGKSSRNRTIADAVEAKSDRLAGAPVRRLRKESAFYRKRMWHSTVPALQAQGHRANRRERPAVGVHSCLDDTTCSRASEGETPHEFLHRFASDSDGGFQGVVNNRLRHGRAGATAGP